MNETHIVAERRHAMSLPSPAYNWTIRGISPVTLNKEWPITTRLVFMLAFSIFGNLSNGFFVASFFVERLLRRVGNVFLCFLGLLDLSVSSVVAPVVIVVMLSDSGDDLTTCKSLQFFVTSIGYAYFLFFALLGYENYIRICCSRVCYNTITAKRVAALCMVVLILSFGFGAAGTYWENDYDYCERAYEGSLKFRLATIILFYIIPFLATVFFFSSSMIRVRARARHAHYRRSIHYSIQRTQLYLNIAAYILYNLAWLPFFISVNKARDINDSKFYGLSWVGILRSLLTCLMYSIMELNFRRAYAHLFYYCCCKSTLSGPAYGRHRRAVEYRPAGGEVRVHIMHQAVNTNSPQRALLLHDQQEL